MLDNFDKNITTKDVSIFLGISVPTVRNWVRLKYISFPYNKSNLENLKKNIENGSFKKLQKGANKNNSKFTSIPQEHINNRKNVKIIKTILNIANEYFTDIINFILNTSVAYLFLKNEVSITDKKIIYKRKIIKKIISDYSPKNKINIEYINKVHQHIKQLDENTSTDILGLLYESFKNEGNKAQSGSYYTPIEICNVLNSGIIGNIKKYYDPCCGTGSFLINIVKRNKVKIENIFGTDSDKTAVFITKINLLCLDENYDDEPNIFCADFLTNNLNIKANVMVENPPWGAAKNAYKYKDYQQTLASKEIFSCFIIKSIESIEENGEMIFLLPKSILNIKAHCEIRKIIVNETTIISIQNFGKLFSNVYTDVIAIHIKKTQSDINNKIHILSNNNNFHCLQSRFKNAENYVFNIDMNIKDENIIDKVFSRPHTTLKNNSIWALGVITGNNSKFISKNKSRNNEEIIIGTDIQKYYINPRKNFIELSAENIQQMASLDIYRNREKIVYRFINQKLTFAYDDSSLLTLNSANILIPTTLGYTPKAAVAMLNSKLFQFLFEKIFSTHKILRSNLEILPFPIILDEEKTQLELLVDDIIQKKSPTVSKKNERLIDKKIYSFFYLSEDEIAYIEKTIL